MNEQTSGLGLAEVTTFFARLYDGCPHAVCVRDHDGNLAYCNSAAARLYDYGSVEEMLGDNNNFVFPQSEALSEEEDNAPLISMTGLNTVRTIKGYSKLSYLVTSQLSDENNNTIATCTVHIDPENAAPLLDKDTIIESANTGIGELEKIFNQNLVSISTATPDKIVRSMNDKTCEMFRASREELMAADWTKFTHPQDLATEYELWQKTLTGEIDNYRLQKRFFRSDNTVFYADVAVECVRKSSGEPDYYIAIIIDITDRMMAEQYVEHKLRVEELIATTSTRFLNPDYEDISDEIIETIKATIGFIGAERGYIITFDPKMLVIEKSYIYRDDTSSIPRILQSGSDMKQFTYAIGLLKNNEIMCFSDIDELPPDAAADKYAFSVEQTISAAAAPMFIDNVLAGFFLVTNRKNRKEWTDEDKNLLSIIVDVIGGALTRRKAEEELQRKLEMEELISSLSARFLRSDQYTIRDHISTLLQEIGVFVGADQSFFTQFNDDLSRITRRIDWCSDGSISRSETTQKLDLNAYSWSMNQLREGKTLNVSSIAKLPEEAGAEKALWSSFGIESLLAIPVLVEGRLHSYLGFTTTDRRSVWSGHDINLLIIAGHILSEVLARISVESDLARHQARLVQSAAIANLGYWYYDYEDGTLVWSEETYRMCGVDPTVEMTTDNFVAGLHPDDRDRIVKAVDFAVNNRGLFDEEYRVIRDDNGEEICLRTKSAHVYDEYGNVIQLTGAVQDITEYKKALYDLQENEERFRQTFDNAPMGASMIGTDSRFIRVNKKLCQILGYTEDELCSMSVADITHPEDRELSQEKMREVIDGKTDFYQIDKRYMRKDGGIVWIRLSVGSVSDSNGKLLYLLPMMEDITERKEAHNAVRESEAALARASELAHLGYYTYDLVNYRLMWSPQLCQIFGLAPDTEMTDDKFYSMVHPDDLESLHIQTQKAIENKASVDVEYRFYRSDGMTRYAHAIGHISYNEDGAPQRALGVVQDITERKYYEQALLKSEEHSRALADLSQKFAELMDFSKIAEAACRGISEMVACNSGIFRLITDTGGNPVVCLHHHDCEMAESLKSIFMDLRPDFRKVLNNIEAGPVVLDNLAEAGEYAATIAQKTKIGPAIITPLYTVGRVHYVLVAFREVGPKPFNKEDSYFLQNISSTLSTSLTNAVLYERETNIAQTFQKSLIPEVPEIWGFDISSFFRPGAEGVKVGGDFFDIIRLADGRVCIVVGDVSGKGLESAVITSQTKYMLRAFAFEDISPESVISSLNNSLCAFLSFYSFVALFYCVIDLENKTLEYISAGQELPIVKRAGGGFCEALSCGGPVLGMIEDHQYESQHIKFEKDDILVCYTDGVTDIPREDDWFGYDRLIQTVEESTASTSADMANAIRKKIDSYAGGNQKDDQLVLVTRLTAD